MDYPRLSMSLGCRAAVWSTPLDVLCVAEPWNHTVRVCGTVIVLGFPHKLVQNDRLGGMLDTCQ